MDFPHLNEIKTRGGTKYRLGNISVVMRWSQEDSFAAFIRIIKTGRVQQWQTDQRRQG